jgi:hypothetical protein
MKQIIKIKSGDLEKVKKNIIDYGELYSAPPQAATKVNLWKVNESETLATLPDSTDAFELCNIVGCLNQIEVTVGWYSNDELNFYFEMDRENKSEDTLVGVTSANVQIQLSLHDMLLFEYNHYRFGYIEPELVPITKPDMTFEFFTEESPSPNPSLKKWD